MLTDARNEITAFHRQCNKDDITSLTRLDFFHLILLILLASSIHIITDYPLHLSALVGPLHRFAASTRKLVCDPRRAGKVTVRQNLAWSSERLMRQGQCDFAPIAEVKDNAPGYSSGEAAVE